MTALRRHLAGYLSLRRGMGQQLSGAEYLLTQFVSYLDGRDAATVTLEHALAWVILPAPASAGYLSQRMAAVRGFATYLHSLSAGHQIPPPGLFPSGEPAGSAASRHRRRAGRLSAQPRPVAPGAARSCAVHLPGRHPAALPQRLGHLHHLGGRRWAALPARKVPPADP